MVAIADCVGFYAAWHQSVEPSAAGVAVGALSNNDGCLIALSPEAKALGATRTMPWFKVQEELTAAGMLVFSSKYREYQSMNKRIMKIIARYVPKVETYSIDECWLDLSGMNNIKELVQAIISNIKKLTGIQIRVGVAKTKTLAKVAIGLAKNNPGNYMILHDSEAVSAALKATPVEDLWGIGRQHATMLYRNGICTAARFAATPESWIRKKMTVTGWRTLQELNGISCIQFVEMMDPKKNIGVGRSFRKTTSDRQTLVDAATFYSFRLSEKLREERLLATVITVKLRTNKWKVDTAQHQPSRVFHLDRGISNVLDICRYAQKAIMSILDDNEHNKVEHKYMKFEINAAVLIPENENQMVINGEKNTGRKNRLSQVIDEVNLQLGKGKICFANNIAAWKAETNEAYIMRQDYPSPSYFTDWNEAPLLK